MPLEAEYFVYGTWDPFPEGPETFSHPESHRKISNLFPSIALRISTAHDVRVISARISARARTKREIAK